MPILDGPEIITGMKPIKKNRPETVLAFDKEKPLGPYNYPMFSYAYYRIKAYRRDAAGIRHPLEWVEKFPMGQRVNLKISRDVVVTSCEKMVGGPIQKCNAKNVVRI